MGNNFCKEYQNDNNFGITNNNKFGINIAKSKSYFDIKELIILLELSETSDELKDYNLKDEKLKEDEKLIKYLKEKNKNDEIILYLEAFNKSNKLSMNMFIFYPNDIKILRFEKNLEKKIKLKKKIIFKINYPMNFIEKYKYSRVMLKNLFNVTDVDMELTINN